MVFGSALNSMTCILVRPLDAASDIREEGHVKAETETQ